jgi:hypothetical protein
VKCLPQHADSCGAILESRLPFEPPKRAKKKPIRMDRFHRSLPGTEVTTLQAPDRHIPFAMVDT